MDVEQTKGVTLSTVNLPVDVEQTKGVTLSTVNLPVNLTQTNSVNLVSSNVPVDIEQVIGSTISPANPLPSLIVGPLDTHGNLKVDLAAV